MPLDVRFRTALYAVSAMLLITGVAWLATEQLKDISSSDLWSAAAPILLMLHGGAAMLALMLLGALVPVHLWPAWQQQKNRIAGIALAALVALLIITAFGLYYIGSDTFRKWTSDLHIALGLAFPGLLIAHIAIGRRQSVAAARAPNSCPSSSYSRAQPPRGPPSVGSYKTPKHGPLPQDRGR